MPLLARTIATPLAIEIKQGAVNSLGPLLADVRVSGGGAVAVAVGPHLGEEIARELKTTLPDAPIVKVEGGKLKSARQLTRFLREDSFDALVGIGGGGTIDVGKYAASMAGLPFVAVATNLAHDGLASPVSVLEKKGKKGSFGVHIPLAVVVDLDYVARSPVSHIRSGIGDAASNVSAVADWHLAAKEQGEAVDGLAAAIARTAGEAVIHQHHPIDSPRFLSTLAESLVLSGLAMAVAGNSRPASGGCHEISHAIDSLFPGTGLHGEQVAVGTMFACFLRGDSELDDIDACFRRYGLARTPSDLGLDRDQFVAAVQAGPGTRPDRYTILEHLDLTPEQTGAKVDEFMERFAD